MIQKKVILFNAFCATYFLITNYQMFLLCSFGWSAFLIWCKPHEADNYHHHRESRMHPGQDEMK